MSGGLFERADRDRGAFVIEPKTCFAGGLLHPVDSKKTCTAGETDARLAKGSDAIDKGEVLPGLNDGFTGKAPDLGG